MKLDNLKKIVKEELQNHFKNHPYSLKDEMIITNEVMLGELLNPDNSYSYIDEGKGIWSYKDMNDVKFIVRLTYQPKTPIPIALPLDAERYVFSIKRIFFERSINSCNTPSKNQQVNSGKVIPFSNL